MDNNIEITVEPVTDKDIEEMAPIMREADVEEVWASSMLGPKKSLEMSVGVSTTSYVARANGEILCIFGVMPRSIMTGVGVPWLLATDNIKKYSFAFLSYCRHYVDEMLMEYPVLFNYVDDRNDDAIRWLRWLGFDVAKTTQEHGALKLPFRRFDLRRV